MLTLSLFRHAKAEPAVAGQSDFERPLTERGRHDAMRIGSALAERRYDLAFVSPARRTLETWEIVRTVLRHPPNAKLERELYLCGTRKLIARIRHFPSTAHNALIVAHNPDMQELALWLACDDDSQKAQIIRRKFPTGAIATFTLDLADWVEFGPKRAKLEDFMSPAELNEKADRSVQRGPEQW